MPNFKKGLNQRIISLTIAMVFLFTNVAYGIDPSKPHLRTPLVGNTEEGNSRLKSIMDRVRSAWHGDSALAIEDVFNHIIAKADLGGVVNITEGIFPVNESQYPVCELWPDGTLVLHPEFILDFNHIKSAGISFDYEFPDGVKRRVDLADSIAYRVAMHEFKLLDREGHGHGYIDEEGDFRISRDAGKANIIGKRYGLIDDAMWLWYLHSYKISDNVRYDNSEFEQRIDWIFGDTGEVARAARAEFPRLEDPGTRDEAIRLALMINRMFFIDRKAIGPDINPAYEKLRHGDTKGVTDAKTGVFATELSETRVELPEDVIEVPQKRYRIKPERELEERQIEERASVEIQKDISILIARLSKIQNDYKNAITDEARNSIFLQKDALLEDIRALYRNMPVEIHGGMTPKSYSDNLKALKERREDIYKKIEEADRSNNRQALVKLNLEAIRNNRLLIKLQLLTAGLFLSGKSGPKAIEVRRNAATWALYGALESANMLEDELHFRTQRLRALLKIEEIETTDWVGSLVRTFRLGGFDIELSGKEGDEEPKVTVRQQRWINVISRLDSVIRDVRRGKKDRAAQKIGAIIDIYNIRYIVTLERYRDIIDDLKRIRAMVHGLPESQAPPAEDLKKISEALKDLAQNITHPKLKVWADVEYKSLEKAFRGKIKTIAGYESECVLIRRKQANLEYYAKKLKSASQKGHISNRNKEIIKNGIARLIAWVACGFVDPKQFVGIHLQPIIDFMNANDFAAAEDYCRKVVKDLDKRLEEIDGIVGNVKIHAYGIYAEYRDADIIKKTGEVDLALKAKDFELALSMLTELRELYFGQELSEPGYVRAEKLIRKITGITRGADRMKNHDLAISTISGFLDELKGDISHKRSFRITVTREDGKSRQFFINPGTSVMGVLNSLKRNPAEIRVSAGWGWIQNRPLDKVNLPDGSHVYLQAKGESAPVRATEGGEYRTEGHGDSGEGILNLVEIHRTDI